MANIRSRLLAVALAAAVGFLFAPAQKAEAGTLTYYFSYIDADTYKDATSNGVNYLDALYNANTALTSLYTPYLIVQGYLTLSDTQDATQILNGITYYLHSIIGISGTRSTYNTTSGTYTVSTITSLSTPGSIKNRNKDASTGLLLANDNEAYINATTNKLAFDEYGFSYKTSDGDSEIVYTDQKHIITTTDAFAEIAVNTGSAGQEIVIYTRQVPEPASLAILGFGLAGLAAVRRRRRQSL